MSEPVPPELREQLGWNEFIDPDNCEFCGGPDDGRQIRRAIDGAWAHAECLEMEVPEEDDQAG